MHKSWYIVAGKLAVFVPIFLKREWAIQNNMAYHEIFPMEFQIFHYVMCVCVCVCVYIYTCMFPGSNPNGDEIFRPSRPALGPTQSSVKLVPGLSRG